MKKKFRGEKSKSVSWKQEVLLFCWSIELTELRCKLWSWKSSVHSVISLESQDVFVLSTLGTGGSTMISEQKEKIFELFFRNTKSTAVCIGQMEREHPWSGEITYGATTYGAIMAVSVTRILLEGWKQKHKKTVWKQIDNVRTKRLKMTLPTTSQSLLGMGMAFVQHHGYLLSDCSVPGTALDFVDTARGWQSSLTSHPIQWEKTVPSAQADNSGPEVAHGFSSPWGSLPFISFAWKLQNYL